MKSPIIHIREKKRFEMEVGGHLAYVEYVERDGCLDIIHTYVPKPIGGREIGRAHV